MLCLEQRLIKNCEHGIFAEAITRAEYALVRLPQISIGLGMITWFMNPPELSCPLCCALAAVAILVNGKPRTIALTAHEDDFPVVSQLAQYRYGKHIDRIPPLISLSRHDEFDAVVRTVVREHAGLRP